MKLPVFSASSRARGLISTANKSSMGLSLLSVSGDRRRQSWTAQSAVSLVRRYVQLFGVVEWQCGTILDARNSRKVWGRCLPPRSRSGEKAREGFEDMVLMMS